MKSVVCFGDCLIFAKCIFCVHWLPAFQTHLLTVVNKPHIYSLEKIINALATEPSGRHRNSFSMEPSGRHHNSFSMEPSGRHRNSFSMEPSGRHRKFVSMELASVTSG